MSDGVETLSVCVVVSEAVEALSVSGRSDWLDEEEVSLRGVCMVDSEFWWELDGVFGSDVAERAEEVDGVDEDTYGESDG